MITDDKCIVLGNIDLYLSPELYAKNKWFLSDFTETGEVNLTSSMLTRFRTQLNDQNYSILKIYGFKNSFAFSQKVMKKDDFVLPDFKIDITIKKPTIVDISLKKMLEFSYSILEGETKIKEIAPKNIEELQGQSGYINKLSEKVNLKSLTHAFENFFYMI